MIIDNNPEEFDIKKRNKTILSITVGFIIFICIGILFYQSVLQKMPLDQVATKVKKTFSKNIETEEKVALNNDALSAQFDENGVNKENQSEIKEGSIVEYPSTETNDEKETRTQTDNQEKNSLLKRQIKIKEIDPNSFKQPNLTDKNAIQSYPIKKGQSFWSIVSNLGFSDPWRWKYLLKQNEEKVHSVIFDVNNNKWQVHVEPGTILTNDPNFKFKQKVITTKKYAFQLISLEEKYRNKAVEITRKLINKGYYAYLYKTKRKIYSPTLGKSIFFNRVRIGFFDTAEEARKTAEEVINKNIVELDSDDYFIVVPSKSELQGIKNDLGIQNTTAYVIQVSNYKSKQSAVNQYSKTLNYATFAYISKLRFKGATYYRNRIGFFETKKEAYQLLKKINRSFKNAKIIKVTNIFENALGQNLGTKTFDLIK